MPLLIDTLSNGTAIKYEVNQSDTSIAHRSEPEIISSPNHELLFNGFKAVDTLCLEDFFRRYESGQVEKRCISAYEFVAYEYFD